MAQSGYTPILIYASGSTGNTPSAANLTSSASGAELALNYFDGKLFYKDASGNVQVLASKAAASTTISFGTTGLTPSTASTGAITVAGTLITSNGGTGLSSYTAGDLPYYASGTALSKLAIGTSGYVLTSSGTAPQWTQLSTIGVTTFSAGTTGFTPSSATSGAVTLAGTLATTNGGTGLTSFTANGVVYASSTSALATGSALKFDGTNLSTTGAIYTDTLGNYSSSSIPLTFSVSSYYKFMLGATQAMTLDTSGNLLVGATNNYASSRLFVNNSITTDYQGTIGMRYNGSGAINNYYKGMTGTNLNTSSARGLHLFNYDSDSNPGIVFWPNGIPGSSGIQAMTLNTNGTLTFNQSGQGIQFTNSSAITNSILNDYETGTWTASIPMESGTSWTITSQTSRYTKVGNLVTINSLINYSAVGNGTISYISLPFTPVDGTWLFQGKITGSTGLNYFNTLNLTQYSGANAILTIAGTNIYYWSSTSAWRSAGALFVSGSYQTTF